MARPRHEHPTPAELEILQVLWDREPATVREVMGTLGPGRQRAYTSVMSLMNVMADKGLLNREPAGKAFTYSAAVSRDRTVRGMLGDLMDRAFRGSASALVAHLLPKASPDELDEIRRLIEQHRRPKGGRSQ